MKKTASVVLMAATLAFVVPPAVVAGGPAEHASTAVSWGADCGVELLHGDRTWEGYIVVDGVLQDPDYGSLAECYSGSAQVCGVTIYVTGWGTWEQTDGDIYVWDDAAGQPGTVLAVRRNAMFCTAPYYPRFERCTAEFYAPVCTGQRWWIGLWSYTLWTTVSALGTDGDSTGCPEVKIPPGLGYPSGWQPASVVWGPSVKSFGIGALVNDCPTPVHESTWGAIKALYR